MLSGDFAFKLYDTFGFPIDLTELLCAERGLTVDMATFEMRMEQQRELGRKARAQQTVRATEITTDAPDPLHRLRRGRKRGKVLEIHPQDDALLVITDRTPFYAEMGGQLGDQGTLQVGDETYPVRAVEQIASARAHNIPAEARIAVGDAVTLKIDPQRRRPIEAHHTATHLLHWALHEVVSEDASQQGSLVSRTRLRFDVNAGAIRPEQIDALEEKVNAAIEAGDPVSWIERPYAEIKDRKDIQQFFGDKYGDEVRIVQIGGQPAAWTATRWSSAAAPMSAIRGDIGMFKIKSEGAIASGVRRIEAVCGTAAHDWIRGHRKIDRRGKRTSGQAPNNQRAAERLRSRAGHLSGIPAHHGGPPGSGGLQRTEPGLQRCAGMCRGSRRRSSKQTRA